LKIAAISDVHGNLAALEAVLADIATQSVDVTVNLGDILSGPLWVSETADRLMALGLPTISGNHERQLLTLAKERMGASDAFAAAQLNEAQRGWLRALPATWQLSHEVFCCHGTPSDDLQYFLETVTDDFSPGRASGVRRARVSEATERAGCSMLGVPDALILCGHSHVPRVVRLLDGRLIVNPGSVGLQAYDDVHPHPHDIETGSTHACYGLLTRQAAGWKVELRRVPYDHERAATRAADSGRKDWAHALRTGFVGGREA
jgi:predicted phosphodiesterase